jgi:hypothetical protein
LQVVASEHEFLSAGSAPTFLANAAVVTEPPSAL